MNDPLQDDRLSAYLDGELTDEERAELEAELAADPARQQVVEELRSLSATLRSLPRQTLGDDFRDQVLRKAERAMLAAPGEKVRSGTVPIGAIPAGPLSTSTDQSAKELADRTVLPIGYSRRGWVWAALAVAAALLIMIRLNRQDHLGLEVARHEPLPALADKSTASTDSADSATIAAGEETEDLARERTEAFASKGGPAVDELASSRAKLGRVAKSAAESDVRSSHESLDADAKSGLAFRSDQAGEAQWEFAAKAGKSADKLPNAASRVMVVHVDMAPKAVESNRFNTVLLSHGIQCEAGEKYGVNPTLAYREPERKTKDGLEDAKKSPPSPYPSRSDGESYRGAGAMARSSGGQATNEDVLFVCADYRQVAGALAQLQQESNDFPAVEIDPAPTVDAQQSLARFTRGRVTNSLAAADYVNQRQRDMRSQVTAAEKLAVTPADDAARPRAVPPTTKAVDAASKIAAEDGALSKSRPSQPNEEDAKNKDLPVQTGEPTEGQTDLEAKIASNERMKSEFRRLQTENAPVAGNEPKAPSATQERSAESARGSVVQSPQGPASQTAPQEQVAQSAPQVTVAKAPQLAAQPQSKSGIDTEIDQVGRSRGQVDVPEEERLFHFFAGAPADSDGQEAVARAERVAPAKRPIAEQLIQQRRLENRSQQSGVQQFAKQLQEKESNFSDEARDRSGRKMLGGEQSDHVSKRDAQALRFQKQAEGQRVPSAAETAGQPTVPRGNLADEPVQVLFVLNVVPPPPLASENQSTQEVAPPAKEPESKD